MISIIIPTYGEPNFLGKSINSVIGQTYNDWELIIVDDNDPDTRARSETEELVASYKDDRIKYVRHPHNRNGAAARNTALQYAVGDYISFLDSDDEYLPTRLEICKTRLDSALKNNADVGGVYTGCEFKRSGTTYRKYRDVKDGRFIVETLACRFMFCTGSNLFITRAAATEVGGFDECFFRHQDYEFLVRFFQKFSLVAIPQILLIKNNENLNLPNVHRMASIKEQYLSKYRSIIEQLPSDEQNYIYQSNYIALGEAAIRTGNNESAAKFYKQAQSYGLLSLKVYLRKIAIGLKAKMSGNKI